MTRWEYRFLEMLFVRNADNDLTNNLNSVGVDGWEAVGMHVDAETARSSNPSSLERRHIIVLLKRPLPEPHVEPRVRSL